MTNFKSYILEEEESPIARERGYKISIYEESLGNPSFHVRYKNEYEVVLQIKDFKILEVKFGNYKKNEFLPNKIMKEIKEILLMILDDGKTTNWKFMIITWNKNNSKHKLPFDTKMP